MWPFKKKTPEEAPVELKVGQIWAIEDGCPFPEAITAAVIVDVVDGWVKYRFVHGKQGDFYNLGTVDFVKKEDMFRNVYKSLLDQTVIGG